MQTFFTINSPSLNKCGIVGNHGKNPVLITHIECTEGTLGYMRIGEDYQTIFTDVKKNTIMEYRLLMSGETMERLPDVVFVNGKTYEPMVELIRHYWPIFGTSHWYIKMTPLKEVQSS